MSQSIGNLLQLILDTDPKVLQDHAPIVQKVIKLLRGCLRQKKPRKKEAGSGRKLKGNGKSSLDESGQLPLVVEIDLPQKDLLALQHGTNTSEPPLEPYEAEYLKGLNKNLADIRITEFGSYPAIILAHSTRCRVLKNVQSGAQDSLVHRLQYLFACCHEYQSFA